MVDNKTSPLVTIIIPAYNYGRFIGEALDSVRNQSYSNWECHVIDDGSIDNTREIVSSYISMDSRVNYIYQINQGPCSARNNGIKQGNGKYIQFLDADDLLEANKLKTQVDYLEQHTDIDIIYGDWRHFDIDDMSRRFYSMGTDEQPDTPRVSGKGNTILRLLLQHNFLVISAPLIRRKTVEAVGEFDESFSTVEDWEYWIRCATQGATFQYLDMPSSYALIRMHSKSLSRCGYRMTQGRVLLRRKQARLIEDPELALINQNQAATDEGLFGVEEMKAGNRSNGVRQMIKAGILSLQRRERWKWLYLAMVTPFVPSVQIESVVFSPVRRSLCQLIRRRKLLTSNTR